MAVKVTGKHVDRRTARGRLIDGQTVRQTERDKQTVMQRRTPLVIQ